MYSEKFNKPIKVILFLYIMHYGPCTGYDIAKTFKQYMEKEDWKVPETKNLKHHTKLYPILADMEKDRIIKGIKTETKKEYEINPLVLVSSECGRDTGEVDLADSVFTDIFFQGTTQKTYTDFIRDNFAEYYKGVFENPYIQNLKHAALPNNDYLKILNTAFSKVENINYLSVLLYFRDILAFTNSRFYDPERQQPPHMPVNFNEYQKMCSKHKETDDPGYIETVIKEKIERELKSQSPLAQLSPWD
jgi:hypothetical protein